jgi:hypothetical protein
MGVANNAEAIGRLLANSTLLRGERELLRRQDQPPGETPKPALQSSAPPITNDAKAVAAVLLTLLDERLASEAAAAGRSEAPAESRRTIAADAGNAPKAIAAKYADDSLNAGGDTMRFDPAFSPEQSRLREMPAGNATELQSFIQRLAAIAAGRSEMRRQSGFAGIGGERGASAHAGGITVIRIAAVVIAVLCVGVLIAGALSN